MKCIKCGHLVEPDAVRTVDAELKGERVSVTLNAPQCMNCGRVVILGRNVRTYHRAVSDAYRHKVGLLTTDEIDRLRRNLSMTWPEFARYVFVGIATIKRWRRGEIQTQALDRLIRLRADPRFLDEARSELHVRLASAALRHQVRRRPVLEWATVVGAGVEPAPVVPVVSSDVWKDPSAAELGVAA